MSLDMAWDNLALALVTGVTFGVLMWSLLRLTWSQMAMVTVFLYLLQTLPQTILRTVQDEGGSSTEIGLVFLFRMTFGVSAVFVVYLLERRRHAG